MTSPSTLEANVGTAIETRVLLLPLPLLLLQQPRGGAKRSLLAGGLDDRKEPPEVQATSRNS